MTWIRKSIEFYVAEQGNWSAEILPSGYQNPKTYAIVIEIKNVSNNLIFGEEFKTIKEAKEALESNISYITNQINRISKVYFEVQEEFKNYFEDDS